MKDTSVGIRELKNNLSKYMRRVKRGETIVITEYGKPIGRIIAEGSPTESRLQGLIAAGVLRWNGEKLPSRSPAAINQSASSASDLISEDRDVDYLS